VLERPVIGSQAATDGVVGLGGARRRLFNNRRRWQRNGGVFYILRPGREFDDVWVVRQDSVSVEMVIGVGWVG
jgi:hypothetical protein